MTDLAFQIASLIISLGVMMWRINQAFAALRVEQQAAIGRLESLVHRIDSTLQAHAARSEERHQSSTRRIDEQSVELQANRKLLNHHAAQLAALGARS